jgi:hypothetical protein
MEKMNGKTESYTALIHNKADCVGFARGLNDSLKLRFEYLCCCKEERPPWVR